MRSADGDGWSAATRSANSRGTGGREHVGPEPVHRAPVPHRAPPQGRLVGGDGGGPHAPRRRTARPGARVGDQASLPLQDVRGGADDQPRRRGRPGRDPLARAGAAVSRSTSPRRRTGPAIPSATPRGRRARRRRGTARGTAPPAPGGAGGTPRGG